METEKNTGKKESKVDPKMKEVIEGWKAKYGVDRVKQIVIHRLSDPDADPLIIYARVPDRSVVSQYWQWVDKNLKKAGEILIMNCVLHGKDAVLADDEYFNTAALNLGQLIPIGRAEIKNC